MKAYCAAPSCPVIVDHGRCARHAVEQAHQRSNYELRRWYRTRRWFLLRAQVLAEQPYCPLCVCEGVRIPCTDVDHVVRHDGQPDRFWDRHNLQGLCHAHHSAKTARGE